MAPLPHLEPITEESAERNRLRRQWVLGRIEDPARSGWIAHELGSGLRFLAHPDLRVRRFGDETSGLLLVGTPFHARLGMREAEQRLRDPGLCEHEPLARFLDGLGGTYVVIRFDLHSTWIYSDPAAMLGVYYAAGRAASSPSLLPGLERDTDLDREYPLGGRDDWYTGSLTPFLGVRALLANHALDVFSGATVRFWPHRAVEAREPEEGLREASELLRLAMRDLTDLGPLLVSLTGGRDSRVNLAAAKELAQGIHFFTLRSTSIKACDREAPEQLARDFQLDHRFVDPAPTAPWLTEMYDEMTGGLALGTRREILGTCNQLASNDGIHVNGNLGAITKSFFWPTPSPKQVKRRALAKEFVNKSPRILAGIDEWLSSLPEGLPAIVVYNLMYLEQRGGRWMGVGETASNLFYESVTPFCSRELFETISGLPTRNQYGGTLLVDFVRELWPELLGVPYCRQTRNWGSFLPVSVRSRMRSLLTRIQRIR